MRLTPPPTVPYVDKVALYQMGARIQDDDAKLPELRRDFAAERHHAFSDRLCVKTKGE